jgi:hypothetical protein
MNADQFRDLVQNGQFSSGESARDQTVAAAREALVRSRRARPPRRRQLALAGAALVALLAIGYVTPPGQAASNWVSGLVSGPNNFEPGEYGYQLQTSTLIGFGELQTGDRYQLRGYVGNGNDGGCVVIVWETSDRSVPSCANVTPGWKADDVSEAQVIGRLPEDEKTPSEHGTFVMGTAPEQTTDVTFQVPASKGVEAADEHAQLFPIKGEISDTTGASAEVPPVQFFVGYLPPGAGDLRSAPAAEAVAFNGDNEVGAAKLAWVSFRPSPDAMPFITPCTAGDTLCDTLLSHPNTAVDASP